MAGGEVIALYRAMQRSARKFTNYNIREYVQRKVREEFHNNAGLRGEELAAALSKARADQEVIQRQVEVYKMFGSPVKSILDLGRK